jgi:8-oxo-dGTP pyrophosphatase MutT (NUDIX family)
LSTDDQRRRLLIEWIERGPEMVCADDSPEWLLPLISALRRAQPGELSTNDPPAREIADRQAAVLILLGGAGPDRVDVLLTQRASGLRDHPGEISFPGGSWEPADTSPVDTALREAAEETGVDPTGIAPLMLLPRLLIRASGFDVTAVVGYWRHPSAVAPTDPAETQRVFSVPLRELARPERWNNYTVPGWSGPSTRLDDLDDLRDLDDGALLWGYTAELLAFMSSNVK